MPFTLLVLVVAILVSYLRGGRLSRIPDTPLHWSWLLFAGLFLQLGVDLAVSREWLVDAATATWLLLLFSQVLVLAWVVRNWALPGMLLVGIGLLLNAVVMAANGAMPVSLEAIRAVGVEDPVIPLGKHTVLDESTRLPWLADIWALAPLRSVISIGDVVLAAGLLPLLHHLMTYRPPHERRRRQAAHEEIEESGD